MGLKESNEVDVLDIRQALLIFNSFLGVIVVQSDSRNAISCVHASHRCYIFAIRDLCLNVSVCLQHVRDANNLADSMAKQYSIDRVRMFFNSSL